MELLGHDTVSATLIIAILLLGVIAALYVLTKAFLRTREVRVVTAAVESTADKHEFAQQFEAISLRLETSPLLQAQWASFKSTLFFSHNPHGGASLVQSTANAHELFSAERVSQGWRDERLLPSLFLTLAMLLAVIGAAASMATALNALSPSVVGLETEHGTSHSISNNTADKPPSKQRLAQEAPNPANAQQVALRQFLTFGKSSLILAVVGLIISLFLTFIQRVCSTRLRSSFLLLSHALQQRIVHISFESAVLSTLANISSATSGMDPAVNAGLANTFKSAIEQSSSPQFEHLAEQIQSIVDHQSTLSLEANHTASDRLRDQISELISEQVAGPIRGTNEQLQKQFLDLRESLLSLSNLIANQRNAPLSPVLSSDLPDAPSYSENDLASFVEATERVQNELTSLNRTALQDVSQNLNSKLENEVISPLRDIGTSISKLNDSLDTIQGSIASLSPEGLFEEVSLPDLLANLQNLQTSLEHERTSSNEQLAESFRNQLTDCITQPVREIASSLECFRDKFEAIEENTIKSIELGDETTTVWHETALRIEAKLEAMDDALSAIKSHVDCVPIFVTENEGGDKLLEQSQTSVDHIAHNLETGVLSPLEELIASTERLQQALSEDEFEVADGIVYSGNELLETTKSTATSLLAEVRGLTVGKTPASAHPATFAEEMHRYCEALDQASKAILQHSTAIETQLEQLLNKHSEPVSDADRAATTVDALKASGHNVTREPYALPADQHLPVSDTQKKALKILNSISAGDKTTIARDEFSDEDIDNAILGLAKQARQNWEIARRDLIGKIDRDDGVINELTCQWDASPSTLSNDFRQLIDAAPSDWSHNADVISSAVARTVHLTLGDTNHLFQQPAAGLPLRPNISELKQTVDALDRISDHFTRQTEKSRDVIAAQIASTMAIIERSSNSVFATTSRLRDQLSSGARTVAKDILETLIKTSEDMNSITRTSNETALPALANLFHSSSYAREIIKSEAWSQRNQTGEIDYDKISALHETIFQIANTVASLNENLTTTTDRLVQLLQTLSNDIRIREGQFAMENPTLLDADMAALTTATPSVPLS